MSKTYEAGTLILNQLKTFNEGVVYFEQVIEPAFFGGIDSCLRSFCEDSGGWYGEFELANDSYCWLAPEHWNTTPDEEEPNYKVWFSIDCVNGDNDYWSALFCGVGTASGKAGLMFDFETKELGGKTAWKNCIKNENKLVAEIVALGFKNLNNGHFFLPIKLDSSDLANTWDDSRGELKEDDDCFQPVRNALDTIAKSVPLFDALMESCQGQKTPKKKP